MSSLTDAEVRLKLKEQPESSRTSTIKEQTPAQPNEKPGENALRYINRLMEDQTRYKTKGTSDKSESKFIGQKENYLLQLPVSSQNESPDYHEEETWQRITLAPGVELHLRHPLDPDIQSRVQQVINYAKRMFSIRSYGGNK
jgi:hypothetical protein